MPGPQGGWPATERHGDIELSYDPWDLADTGAAVAITLFHPGSNQAVLVVAAADLAVVEARLRPQLGTSLCVIPSRWTKDQLDDVRGQLHQRWQQWNLYQLGRSTPKTARPISVPVWSGSSRRSRPGQLHSLRAWWPLNHG